jgi:hypothetical protein
MFSKASLTLIVFLLLCTATGNFNQESGLATAGTDAVVERASAGSHPPHTSVIDQDEAKHTSPVTSLHIEPLLLLLLGSALFSVSTTIKLVLSRRLAHKSAQQRASRPSRSLAA